MGEIVAAAVVSHQPGIMLPEKVRRAMNGGEDSSLVTGLEQMRQALHELDVDTLVIFDTHWFTTMEHIVAGADRYAGVYTSDELPTVVTDYRYDFLGAPDLAAAVEEIGAEQKAHVLNATNANIARQYPTINMVHYLRSQDEKVLSVSTCQTAEPHNYLQFGEVLAQAIERTPGRVALLAAGGMSHAFPRMDDIPNHLGNDPDRVISPEARAMDEKILALWADGEHAAVIDLYQEYRPFKPEGFFGHYFMMIGALGGRDCRAKGARMSAYENALGTGQVNVWFDLEPAHV